LDFDIRKVHPYLGYQQLDFKVPLGHGEGGQLGDAHDRFLTRLREITECTELLKQACEAVPSGEFIHKKTVANYAPPAGEAFSRVESQRGFLGCHVVSDGGKMPARVQFRPPSLAHLAAVPGLLQGVRIEDLPVVLASMDLGIAEADR
jgi:NADH-quinone oxidoreductase subunit D